jgi:sugar-phosphatase
MMTTRPIDAVLLDMDGTVLNSIRSAERIWGEWAADHGLDVEAFLPTIHGVQSVETIRRLAIPDMDPLVEAAKITQAEREDVEGIDAIAGAAEFLAALADYPWAIVTSAPRDLALSRFGAAGLPMPPLLIAAEDVEHGKPAPDCFHLAAKRLATTADRCLVLEDSVAGVQAAEASGALVLVVTETHHVPMDVRHPTILDYRDLAIEKCPDGTLSITRAADDLAGQWVSYVLRAPILD